MNLSLGAEAWPKTSRGTSPGAYRHHR